MDGLYNTVIIFVVLVFCDRFPMSEETSSVGNKRTLTTAKLRGSASPKPTSKYKGGRRLEFTDALASTRSGVEILRTHVRDPKRTEQRGSASPKPTSKYREGRRLEFTDALASTRSGVEILRTHVRDLERTEQRGSASPKPTSKYKGGRRLEFTDALASTRSGVGIPRTHVRDPERSKVENLWDWDFWCQLQPDIGKCSAYESNRGSMIRNFYYDSVLDTCRPFRYSRCNGNKNNFETQVECERHCKEAVYMILKETTNRSYCALQPNAGSCIALLERFYYDVRSGECKRFTYGGCGGNQNRFETASLCNRRCKPQK